MTKQEPNLPSSLNGGGHKKMWHCGNVIMWHVGHTVLWEVMEHDNNDSFPPNNLNLQKFKSKEISQNITPCKQVPESKFFFHSSQPGLQN